MKIQIQLPIPVLLNNLYIPVVKYKDGQPYASIVKSKEAKEYEKLVKIYGIKQKVKMLKGKLSFRMDILIKSRKDFDIDAPEKLLLDSLEGIAYKNDRDIIEKISRKFVGAEKDGLIIEIEEIEV